MGSASNPRRNGPTTPAKVLWCNAQTQIRHAHSQRTDSDLPFKPTQWGTQTVMRSLTECQVFIILARYARKSGLSK
ncbi:MAG: hypothetical protein NVS4B1_02950 [Ktedonobacteraceae bacterium]